MLSNRVRLQGIKGGNAIKEKWKFKREKINKEYQPPLDDPFFMLGIGLYWGEGNKWSPSNVGMSNADPRILLTFKKWLETFFECNKYSVQIRHYIPSRDEDIKKWWSQQLIIPIDNFYPSNFCASKSSQKKRNTLLYGTAQLTLRGKGIWIIREKIEKTLTLVTPTGFEPVLQP